MKKILNVPYYSQRDNIVDWHRTCNSSTHAMLLEFLKPNTFVSDDAYIELLYRQYGDTTVHNNHTNLLADVGIDSIFRYDLDFQDLDEQLEKNIPIPIGVFHKGCLVNPHGGHILLVIGKEDESTYIVNDPWGHPFEYDGRSGSGALVPKSSLIPRWLDNKHHSGWGRIVF